MSKETQQRELFGKQTKQRVNITIDPELWKIFKITCENQGSNASQVMSMLAKEYIQNKRQYKLV